MTFTPTGALAEVPDLHIAQTGRTHAAPRCLNWPQQWSLLVLCSWQCLPPCQRGLCHSPAPSLLLQSLHENMVMIVTVMIWLPRCQHNLFQSEQHRFFFSFFLFSVCLKTGHLRAVIDKHIAFVASRPVVCIQLLFLSSNNKQSMSMIPQWKVQQRASKRRKE